MKTAKILFITFTLMAASILKAEAASTANVSITVTIQSVSISVTPTGWPIGTVAAGSTTLMSSANKLTITNDGNVSETFTLQIGSSGSGWTAGSTAGPDTYVLSGLITGTGDTPTGTNFAPEDVISISPQSASATVFGYTGSSNNGAGVPSGASRSLWLQFKAPTSSSVTSEQTIGVTIGASVP
jgi:hypothetical protein